MVMNGFILRYGRKTRWGEPTNKKGNQLSTSKRSVSAARQLTHIADAQDDERWALNCSTCQCLANDEAGAVTAALREDRSLATGRG